MAMYRIEMDAKEARWVIKMSHAVVFWRRVGQESFENYAAAREYVDRLGLDNIYKDYNKGYFSQVMNGASA